MRRVETCASGAAASSRAAAARGRSVPWPRPASRRRPRACRPRAGSGGCSSNRQLRRRRERGHGQHRRARGPCEVGRAGRHRHVLAEKALHLPVPGELHALVEHQEDDPSLLQRRQHLPVGAQPRIGGDALDAVALQPGEEEVGRHHARLLVEHAHRPAGARQPQRHERGVAHVRRHQDRAPARRQRRAQLLQPFDLAAGDEHRLVLAPIEHRHDLEHRRGVDPIGLAQHRRHRRVVGRPAQHLRQLGLHAPPGSAAEKVLQVAEAPADRAGALEADTAQEAARREEHQAPQAAPPPEPEVVSHSPAARRRPRAAGRGRSCRRRGDRCDRRPR